MEHRTTRRAFLREAAAVGAVAAGIAGAKDATMEQTPDRASPGAAFPQPLDLG